MSEYQARSTGGPSRRMNTQSIRTTGEWMKTLLVLLIPAVGLVACILWSVDRNDRERSNFCKAFLVYSLIILAALGGLVYFVYSWFTTEFPGLSLF